MKILELFIYLLEKISESDFMVYIFAICSIIAVFGLLDKKLR